MTITASQQGPGPKPKLSPAGSAALDALLKETVESRVIPATYFGVTGADGELYFNCAGDKVFGSPEQGQVDADTSESPGLRLR